MSNINCPSYIPLENSIHYRLFRKFRLIATAKSILEAEKPAWISIDRYVILTANKPGKIAG